MSDLHHTFPALQSVSAFTLWRLNPSTRPGGKPLKVAVHPDGFTNHFLGRPARDGRAAVPPNPAPLLSYDAAVAAVQQARSLGVGHGTPGSPGYIGLGFRPAGTGFACLDIDDCLVGGQWAPHAVAMMGRFPGAGVELSHSGRGLHLWFRYTGEGPGKRPKDATGRFELYGEGQFIALGRPLAGDAGTDLTDPMRAVVAELWPASAAAPREVTASDWDEKTPEQRERTKAQILSAARRVDLASYHGWVNQAMRMSSLGEDGRQLFHEMSSWDARYDYDDTESKWEDVHAERTDYRAIFAEAQRNGWVNPESAEGRLEHHMAAFGAPLPAGVSTTPPPALEWTVAAVAGWKGKPWGTDQFREEVARDVTPGGKELTDLWNAPVPDTDLITRSLMWKTGGNCEAVASMMGERATRAEVTAALGAFLTWWEPKRAKEAAERQALRDIGEGLGDSVAPTLITLEEMPQRLVYVTEGRRVVDRQHRRVLAWADALGAYAASTHDSKPDAKGNTRQVANLPVWQGSDKRITVDTLTWGPGRPEYCAPPEAVGSRAYNTWRGLAPMVAPGDWAEHIAPFLAHIEYMVPEAAQRARFLQWLAHMVQRPGELPHTAYLMISRITGVGRNWLAGVLQQVLRGYVASGVALGPVLDGKFNGRLAGKLLATVDETREGLSDNRYSRAEALKRIITEEFRHIDHKYGMQVVEYNCCRWLMFSNHADALPLDKVDRRVEVVDNPDWYQPPEYYARIYPLLHDAQFVASVRYYLETLSLAGFNAGERASASEAKRKAIEAVTSDADLAVEELQAAHSASPMALSDVMKWVQDYSGDPNIKRKAVEHSVRRVGGSFSGNRIKLVGNTVERIVSLDPQHVLGVISADMAHKYRESALRVRGVIYGAQFEGKTA